MIKRILVAVDGSSSSKSALSIASSIAGITKAELIGLFVEDDARFDGATDLNAVDSQIESQSLKIYQEFLARCNSANIEGRFLSLRGKPIDIILERAKTADYVVIGNSGLHSGVENKIQGETVQQLLASTARPVLVVPEDVAGEPIVVIAYDGSLPSDRALLAAAQFAEMSDMTSVHLLTVGPDSESCNQLQAPALDYLSAYDLHVTPVCLTGSPEQTILPYASQVDASVLAIGAFGPNHKNDCMFGRTTVAALKQSEVAVLLVG